MSDKNSSEFQAVGDEKEITINFSDIIKGFFKFWWVCLVAAVIVGGAMFYRYYVKFVPTYSVSATFTVTLNSTDTVSGASSFSYYYNTATADQLAETFPTLLGTKLLKSAIAQELNGQYAPATLSMSAVKGTNMFTISSVGSDPEQAYNSLVAAINAYPKVAKYVVGNIKIKLITDPQIPTEPSNTNAYVRMTLVGALVGIILGLCWILMYAIFRHTIRSESDVNRELHSEVLGILPVVEFKKYGEKIDKTVLITNRFVPSRYSEEIKVLRNTIMQQLDDKKTVLISSAAPGEGKTTIVINLAVSMSQADKKVLIIDGDLRNPSVGKNLGIKTDTDSDALWSIKQLENSNVSVLTFRTSKQVMQNIMRVEKLTEIIDKFRDEYDYILIDTPPCGLISDALTFAQASDAAIFTILHDTIRTSRIQNAIDMLNYTDIKLLGCIINGTSSGIASGYGYNKYTYGKYGYGYGRYGHGRYGYYGRYGQDYSYNDDDSGATRS